MNKSLPLKGVGVAMVTPFNQDGTIDINSLKVLCKHLINSKVDYLTILGTTSESPTLNDNEKQLVIDTIMQENNGAKKIVIGLGGNNTQDIVNKIKQLSKTKGVDAILSVSPYYNKPSQKGILEHFTKLADTSSLPIILYNVPGRTGSNMQTATVLELAKHPNIVGIKDASGNLEQNIQILHKKPEDFLFISGDDNLIFSQMCLGANGIISVIANAYPNSIHTIVSSILDYNNIQKARNEYYKLINIVNLIFKECSPSGIKLVLEHLNICSRYLRLPLTEVSQELSEQISDAVKEIK